MNSRLLTLLSLITVTFNTVVAQTTQDDWSCQTYASLGPQGFACNDRSDIICQDGCTSFITAYDCKLSGHPDKPMTNEVCTAGFGRDTAAAKACMTAQGTFRCTGGSEGMATCRNCVPKEKIKWQ